MFLAVNTGMRFSEIRTLRWNDINFDGGYILLHPEKTKTEQPRLIPLLPEVKDELTAFRKDRDPNSDFVFHARKKKHISRGQLADIRGDLNKAIQQAGLKNFRPHDLRHTCASYLALSGVPIRTIAEILGHSEIKTTMRYAHLDIEHLRNSLKPLREFLPKTCSR